MRSVPCLPAFDLARAEAIYKGPHSEIVRTPNPQGVAVKLIRPRSVPRDWFRHFFYGQGKREFECARIMTRLGLPSVAVLGYGFALNPFRRMTSLLFMEPLDDCLSMKYVLKTLRDELRRARLLGLIAQGFGLIYRNGWHHKDTHFGNVLLDTEDRLIWIDNDLRRIRWPKTRAGLLSGAEEQLYISSKAFLSQREWQLFSRTLRETAGV